jgi:hypothetical protein
MGKKLLIFNLHYVFLCSDAINAAKVVVVVALNVVVVNDDSVVVFKIVVDFIQINVVINVIVIN